MSIFMVNKYVIRPDKMEEFAAFFKKTYEPFIRRRKDLHKELKSYRMYSKLAGGKWGEYVEIGEFESLTELEKMMNRGMKDRESTTKITPKLMELVVPGTYAVEIWNSLP